jgi:hypothetical protein
MAENDKTMDTVHRSSGFQVIGFQFAVSKNEIQCLNMNFLKCKECTNNNGRRIPAFSLIPISSDFDFMVCTIRLSISLAECRRLGLAGGTSASPAREAKQFAVGSEMIALYLYFKPTILFREVGK